MKPIYLDNAASTPVEESVRTAMQPFLSEEYGNPSASYGAGVRCAEAMERSRRQVQRALVAHDHLVVFTAGGTEANNLAVLGAARERGPGEIWTGATEHASVRRPAEALQREGHRWFELPLEESGSLDQEKALAGISEHASVVSHMLVNNEVGTRYDIASFFSKVRKKAPKAHLHVDCIQGLGKLDLDLIDLNADSLSVSAHKIHGPKGTGALIMRKGARIAPLIYGGPHEQGMRAGTENVAGVVGFAEALEQAVRNQSAFGAVARECRSTLENGLRDLPGFQTHRTKKSVDSIVSLQVPGAPGQVWQHHLEERGIEVGIGSACQAKSGEISPALKALGMPDQHVRQVLRISFSRMSTGTEVEELLKQLHNLEPVLAGVSA